MLRSRVVTIADLQPPDVSAWAALAASAAEPNPYLEPAFLLPAAQELGEGGRLRLVVVDEPHDDAPPRWVAALAVDDVPGDRRWPWRHASTGSDLLATYCPLGTPLVDAHDPVRGTDLLVRALRRHRRELGSAVDLHLLVRGGPVHAGLVGACAAQGVPVHVWGGDPRGAVRFPGGGKVPAMPRAASLARGRRRFERALGEPLRVEDRAGRPGVARDFLDLEASGWKGDPARGGMAFRLRHGGAAWFERMLDGFTAAGRAHVLTVLAGERVVHMAVVVRAGGAAFGFYDAYAPEWGRFGPGGIGRVLGVAWLAEHTDVRLFDSSVNPSLYPDATALFPDRVDLVSCTAVTGGRAARVVHRAVRAGVAVLHRAQDLRTRRGPR